MPLSTLAKITAAVVKRPEELAEARRNGKKVVGWIGYNIPEELILALGLIPVRLGAGGDDRLVEIGSRYISSKNCVYTRQTVGLFAEGQDPYVQNADLVAFDSTCLQMYRVAEIIAYFFKVNTLGLGVPRNFFLPEARAYFRSEMEEFAAKLADYAGVTLDPARLADSIALLDGIRTKIQELYRFQAGTGPLISWNEVYDVVHAGYYLDREQYSGYLTELLDELNARQGTPVIEAREDEARIFLSGSIIPPGDHKLISIIEKLGGRIVGDDLWSGLAPSLNVRIEEPSVAGLAEAYLNRTPHGALPYLDLESDGRLRNLRRLIETFQAKGVLYHTLRYCDPFSFKAGETKDVVNRDGVPLLEIHTEYAGSDYEAIRTRAEAFVEMLKNRSILDREEIA